ncbi:reverse transcriptase [Gossypium australe]|uniref:Reverse transcriptase n=1 Tax=Gossypium australe TaxID=47621 RepID=A0A5B6WI20_9ROSI|nr:reverse transcriptase [Gossypium australe]
MIEGLFDSEGNWVSNSEGVRQVALDYFHSLFKTEACGNIENVLGLIPHCITSNMNGALDNSVTDKELGIDRLSSLFYKEIWGVVAKDVLKLCHKVLDGRKDVKDINETVIVLIPKVNEPKDMTHFHPISLCRVIYKMISKSNFVSGRMIHDNFLISHELLHYLQNSKNGSNKGFVIKLDISKAYKCVEWDFLEKVMIRIWFSAS